MSPRTLATQLFVAATLLVGCEEIKSEDTGLESAVDSVELTDAHNGSAEILLDIDQQVVAAHTDIVIDWSGLSTDLWGYPSEEAALVSTVSLRLFPDHDAQALAFDLAAGTLRQTDVALEVRCSSQARSCLLADFAFDDSHPIDMVELFAETAGSWLVTASSPVNSEPLAYLLLQPSLSSGALEATLTDDSTAGTMKAFPAIDSPMVPADGSAELDWSGLTHDAMGGPLRLYQLDRLELMLLPAGITADGAIPLHSAHELATERWSANIEGRTTLSLHELASNAGHGFSGFESAGTDEGTWVVTLWASATGSLSPAFVSVLEPSEG
jgi:hypothetical protein